MRKNYGNSGKYYKGEKAVVPLPTETKLRVTGLNNLARLTKAQIKLAAEMFGRALEGESLPLCPAIAFKHRTKMESIDGECNSQMEASRLSE